MLWEGDVAAGDSGSPVAQRNTVQKRDTTLPGRRPGSKSWAKMDIKEAGPQLDQNVLGQLRRGSLGLDSGLSSGLFSAAGRPCQRPATLLGANVALENRD